MALDAEPGLGERRGLADSLDEAKAAFRSHAPGEDTPMIG